MKVVYYIVFFFWYLLSLLPLRFLYIFSDVLYYPLYYCIRYRRKVVRQNLTGSFPDNNGYWNWSEVPGAVQSVATWNPLSLLYDRDNQVVFYLEKTIKAKDDFRRNRRDSKETGRRE